MRILLIEDEKRMAQALCEILRLEKYEVDHYDNGSGGLAAIESNIYDIVILDVMLPCIDGYEIAKRARKQDLTTPILMLTAKAKPEKPKAFYLHSSDFQPYSTQQHFRIRHPNPRGCNQQTFLSFW